jgi:hypothetical protein
MGLAHMEEPVGVLVEWLAARLGIPAAAFADYAARPQTMTDHALKLATTLGLRPPSNADLPFMIEAAAQSAWSTDRAPRLSSASSQRSGPQRSFSQRRRSSSAPLLQGGLGHASGVQMLCWRTFPRRNLLNSTRCSYPIRHSRRRHSPGCGRPRQHRSPTMCGHCLIGSGASARSVSTRGCRADP